MNLFERGAGRVPGIEKDGARLNPVFGHDLRKQRLKMLIFGEPIVIRRINMKVKWHKINGLTVAVD